MKKFSLTLEQTRRLRDCVAFTACKETLPFYEYNIVWPIHHEYLWNMLDSDIETEEPIIESDLESKIVEELLYCIKVYKQFEDSKLKHPASGRILTFNKNYDMSDIIKILNGPEYMSDEEFNKRCYDAAINKWLREEEAYGRAYLASGID